MVNFVKILLVSILFSAVTFGNTNDDELQINAFLNTTETALNVPVTLTVDLFYKDPKQKMSVKLPDLSSSFKILSRSESKALANRNGEIEIKYIYKYQLLPLKEGNLSIPAIKVKTNDEPVLTDPLYLTVGKSIDSPNKPNTITTQSILETTPSSDVILEAQVSTENIYLGESIQYKLVLYRKRNYWNTMNVSFPSFEKAWVQDLEIPKKEQIVTKDNQRYYAYEITNKKITPLESGSYEIPSAGIVFSTGPFNPTQSLQTEAVSINVQILPENAPKNFDNAVGDFNINASIKKSTLLANTPNTLSITLSGTGNLDQINDITINAPETLSIYKSSAQTTLNPMSKEVERLLDYIIVSETAGLVTIPSISFSYFSPSTQTYETLQTTPIQFNVLPNNADTIRDSNPSIKNNTDSLLRPYKLVSTNSQWPKLLIIGLSTLQLSQLGVILASWIRQKRNPNYKKQLATKAAYERAIKTLSKNNDITAYAKLLYEFLETSTNHQLVGATYQTLKETLSKEFSAQAIENIILVLKQVDEHRFTNQKPEQSVDLKATLSTLLQTLKKELI